MTASTTPRHKTQDLVQIAIFAVLIAICSWISIPVSIPFTMQTFAVFLSVAVLGGRRGTMAVLVYLLLGLVGIPVFAGFTGGIGILFGNTGGYMIGFVCSSLFMWGMEKTLGRKTWVLALSMFLGLLICYAFGTAWFIILYAQSGELLEIGTVLGWCVLPFVLPDLLKICLALLLGKRLSKLTSH